MTWGPWQGSGRPLRRRTVPAGPAGRPGAPRGRVRLGVSGTSRSKCRKDSTRACAAGPADAPPTGGNGHRVGPPPESPTPQPLESIQRYVCICLCRCESLNVLWRLFNIVLEFSDKFQIDTSAHMRTMRKRAKANYVQDYYAPTATASTPV